MFSGISQKPVKHHLCHCFARGSVQGQLLIQLYDEPDFFFFLFISNIIWNSCSLRPHLVQ